jgi:hypothetical protein
VRGYEEKMKAGLGFGSDIGLDNPANTKKETTRYVKLNVKRQGPEDGFWAKTDGHAEQLLRN